MADDIKQKQLMRLETQRDRLAHYLSDAKDINKCNLNDDLEEMVEEMDPELP